MKIVGADVRRLKFHSPDKPEPAQAGEPEEL
jgi:hypothetical protein